MKTTRIVLSVIVYLIAIAGSFASHLRDSVRIAYYGVTEGSCATGFLIEARQIAIRGRAFDVQL